MAREPSGKTPRNTAPRIRARVAGLSVRYGVRSCYVESSALLAALLEGDADALDTLRRHQQLVTSALTFAECNRALVREQASGRLTPASSPTLARALLTFGARCTTIPVTAAILDRAGRPFPTEPVRTLDGIHLATVDALGESPSTIVVLTRDIRVRSNALAMGYAVA